jgi:serine/threonine-protein kinase
MSEVSFGKFQIRRELGRGAMGVVYEAHDPSRGTDVALKVLTVASGAAPEAKRRRVERFYREAQALSELSHANIVRVFDRGEVEGRYYFAMEVVRGTTLRDRLQFQGALSLPELVRLTLELCDALEHIHGRGVIHRDIKPENIMLMPDGSAKLMDFGVAELVTGESGASSGGFHGSPAYMSPEQVAGRPVDGRSDLYSLAITLYEAATGKRAVEGDTIPVIIHKVTNEYPPPPSGLPAYFQGALMRAMAKNPNHRYLKAREMAEDIRLGRVPAVNWSALPPPPSPSLVSPVAVPSRVYLGADAVAAPPAFSVPEPVAAAPATPAGPVSLPGAADFILPGTAVQPTPAPPLAPAPVQRTSCLIHPAKASVGNCARCSRAICYTCLVEVPQRGTLCRGCAFGGNR